MAGTTQETFEFRGVDNLVIAEIMSDNAEEFVTGDVMSLSPVAAITKATDSSNEAHYYDNKPLIVVSSESADEIGITMAPPTLEKLALITGKDFDEATGMMIDCERTIKYFALGYRAKGTDGKYRYVWRLKGTFNIPEDTHETENDGTDTTNTEVTFTGISTTHKFTKNNKPAKGVIIDERYEGSAKVIPTFFDSVQTPDTVQATVES